MLRAMDHGTLLGPGEGDRVPNPVGGDVLFKVVDGHITVFESVVAPGAGPPLHTHAAEDEGLYVLAGEMRFRLGEEVSPAPAGTFMFVRRGVPHCFQNVGAERALLLITFTPSGMERFFPRVVELSASLPAPEAFARAGGEVGLSVAGPPLAVSHPLE
jgi:quercetin dioxygenase-like cupin family protein